MQGQPLFERSFRLGLMFQQAAHRHPDTPVTLDRPLQVVGGPRCVFTYRELADIVDDLAARLWEAGVRPSEHVAVHKTDNVDIVLLTCAVSRIGAVPALLSPGLDGVVAAGLLARLDRPWLLTDQAKLTGPLAGLGVEHLTTALLTVDHPSGAPDGTRSLADLAGAPRRPPVRLGPHGPALITHSSGTTNVPKLAVHSARTMWNRLVPQAILGMRTRGETAALHMSFVHSRFYHLLGVLLAGGSPLVLLVDPDPDRVAAVLARTRPGIVETHPNTYVLWEDLADSPDAPFAAVRTFGSTFDAIHPRTVRRLLGASRRRSPWLVQLYGQSETGPVAAWAYTRRTVARLDGRLVGIALPGFTRLRIVDADGRPCPRGAPGQIEARTRGRCLTYLGCGDLYARQDDGGWWRMGDMGYLDRFRGLHLIDREIDQIDTVGSTLAVEDTLLSRLEELQEVVVVAGDDGKPVPVVCTRGDQPLVLARWALATKDLPQLGAPQQWRFDDLPRTSTWKVKRVEIGRMLGTGTAPTAVSGG